MRLHVGYFAVDFIPFARGMIFSCSFSFSCLFLLFLLFFFSDNESHSSGVDVQLNRSRNKKTVTSAVTTTSGQYSNQLYMIDSVYGRLIHNYIEGEREDDIFDSIIYWSRVSHHYISVVDVAIQLLPHSLVVDAGKLWTDDSITR